MPRANPPDGGASGTQAGTAFGTVSLAYLRAVLDHGERQDIAPADQLRAVGVPPELMHASGAQTATRIPGAAYLALLDWLEQVTGDPDVGLRAGAAFAPRHYAEMGYVVLTTPTVRDAILQGIRYEVLANDIGGTRLIETPQAACMTWEARHGPLTRHAHELHMATWVVFARWLIGAQHVATQVEFPHPAPADTRRHAEVFGCPVVFNAARHAMHIERALLDLPSLQADAGMQAQMTRIADTQLQQMVPAGADALAQARAYISGRLPQGELPIADVAAHLRMPVRTLQRRLQAQGISYSQLVDNVRRALAEQYLADPGISLAQCAMRLGYSEQSAFTHAFKRWTGETPHGWRRKGQAA
ncbi:AraC family transcriptional regulator [Cupriavidus sp. UYPR2.512]|uniref:AraC family transcriptional regulator n=1 Tax=Cupriavidus sp. UYPR2.512 TaxID=1080187 RepID=UPI0003AB3392|nr:AraC family transcriptional regulator [Cupriavidus sp. UYPR2.512]UIF86247.1 AraC family transcriptional regulator [Cupriavidus necator]